MGYPKNCPGCSRDDDVNFSSFSPFNDAAHYHGYCQITDWGNQGQVTSNMPFTLCYPDQLDLLILELYTTPNIDFSNFVNPFAWGGGSRWENFKEGIVTICML